MAMTDLLRTRNFALLACAVAALLLAVAFAPPLQAQKSPAERAKAIDNRIMCMCGGCSEAAGKCNHMGGSFSGPCETAQKEMKEVSDRIAMGQSDDLILQSFVQEYGPTVLLSPPARGFDLWAWLMPIIVTLTGIALAGFVVMRWRHRMTVAPAPHVASDLIARARHDMRGEFDD
jgi:cytochrome c-type biogenesis protein CcmH/NrfF